MSGLSQIAVTYLQQAGRTVSYRDGDPIVHRGQSGEAFYAVLSGAVDVLLVAEEGRRMPLARLGPGATFGEMSLLTDDAISADVVAKGAATVLEFPGEQFQTALAECAELRSHVLLGLCQNLRETNRKAWGFFQRAEALRALASPTDRAGPILAQSAKMRKLEDRLADLAAKDGPILIDGQTGTGKQFVARKIHEAARPNDEVPLVIVDCPLLAEGEGCRMLFGFAGRDFSAAEAGPGGLHAIGTLDLADGGTMILRHIEALEPEAQEVLARYLAALADRDAETSPRVRVLATAAEPLGPLAESGRFHPQLAERFAPRTLTVPRLMDRRRDILALAEMFLREHAERVGEGEHRFDRSAEHALVSAEYRYANASELREAVEFAALVADGAAIGSEHIFTGPKDEGTATEYDLARVRPVQWLVRGGLRVLEAALFAVFLAIAAVCLTVPDRPAGWVANALAWGLWWPALLIAFLFIGRAWCAVCPIASVGELTRRFGSLKRTPPQWMKRYSVWLMVALFAGIVWSEHLFHMTERPFATGILFLALMAAAGACCVIFQRQAWCRYLCPLGSLGAGFSVAAMVRVRANPSVCATQCKTHECFKGADAQPGCPVFHHPLYARDGHVCKLCLQCLDICPHGSAKLYLRPPLQGIWRMENPSQSFLPFTQVIFFLSLVMLASHKLALLAGPAAYTAVVAVAIGLGAACQTVLRRMFSSPEAGQADLAPPVGYALLMLAAGPLMAFHLENIPGLASLNIHAASGRATIGAAGGQGLPLLMVLQAILLVLAAIPTGIILWRVRMRFADRGVDVTRWRWRLLWGLCAIYLLSAFALIALPAAAS